MSNIFARFVKNESGATAIEYGLIAALIALAIMVGAGAVGNSLDAKFNLIAEHAEHGWLIARPVLPADWKGRPHPGGLFVCAIVIRGKSAALLSPAVKAAPVSLAGVSPRGTPAMLEALIFVVFPFCMVFAAVSDTLSMTIANRVPLLLLAVFALVAPLTGMGWADYGWHFAAGATGAGGDLRHVRARRHGRRRRQAARRRRPSGWASTSIWSNTWSRRPSSAAC